MRDSENPRLRQARVWPNRDGTGALDLAHPPQRDETVDRGPFRVKEPLPDSGKCRALWDSVAGKCRCCRCVCDGHRLA